MNVINEEFNDQFYFFFSILPDSVSHESSKAFWKNRHFEITRAGFLLRCQNLVRQTSPKMMHFQAWKKEDFNPYCVVSFDQIKIFTYWAPQNDRLNLSFVKDICIVAIKWPEIILKLQFLRLKFSIFFFQNWNHTC